MTTIATHSQHHKVPIAAGLAVAGALAAGGILGVAWQANHDSQTAHNAPAVAFIPSGEYWKTNGYHAPQYQPRVSQRVSERGAATWGGLDGNVAPIAPTAPVTNGGHVVISQ